MAIKAVDLAMSLRYALGDMQGVNVSDYELIEPINQAAAKLYGQLSQRYVHAVIKRSEDINIDPSAEKDSLDPLPNYELPGDFVRIHQALGMVGNSDYYRVLMPVSTKPTAEGTYRIIGTTFYAPKGLYTIEYYYIPARIYSMEGLLDIPESMKTWVEQVAVALFKKDYVTAQTLTDQCELVMAGRQISHFENTTPVQVLGGRV